MSRIIAIQEHLFFFLTLTTQQRLIINNNNNRNEKNTVIHFDIVSQLLIQRCGEAAKRDGKNKFTPPKQVRPAK